MPVNKSRSLTLRGFLTMGKLHVPRRCRGCRVEPREVAPRGALAARVMAHHPSLTYKEAVRDLISAGM
jgi:hypothetical protein